MGAVKDHKGNTSLIDLNLCDNKVGDAGAAALADALQAMVLTCRMCVFRACVCCQNKCRFTKSSQEVASSSCCVVCVPLFFVILLVAWRKTFTHVCGVGGARGLFST